MSVYPTLTDLCGIPRPEHVQGENIRSLLADPSARWSTPALTTFGLNNHAIRTERWRYIRYEDGSEELYDHKIDPNEWTNQAGDSELAKVRKRLAGFIPKDQHPGLKVQDWYDRYQKSLPSR